MTKTQKLQIHRNIYLVKAISAVVAIAFLFLSVPESSLALRPLAYEQRPGLGSDVRDAQVEKNHQNLNRLIEDLQHLPLTEDAPWARITEIFPQLTQFRDKSGQINKGQIDHARRVVNSLHQIRYTCMLLKGVYYLLSEQDKKLVWLAVILHDIGRVEGDKDHHLKGAEIVKELLSAFGYDHDTIQFFSELIKMHTFMGMLSTGEKTPQAVLKEIKGIKELDRFLSLLVLLTAADIKGYTPDRDILTRDKIELLAKCKSIVDIRALSDGFWLYRLRQMAKSDKNSPLDEREEAIFRNIEQYLEMALDGDGARIKRLKQAFNQGIETIHHMQFSLPLLLRLKTDEQDTDEKAAIRFIRLCDFFAAQHEQRGITLVTAELYGNRQLTQEEKGFAQRGLATALSEERDMQPLITIIRGEKLILDIDSLIAFFKEDKGYLYMRRNVDALSYRFDDLARAKKLFDYLGNIAGKRLLIVGSNITALPAALALKGANVTFVDLDESHMELEKAHIRKAGVEVTAITKNIQDATIKDVSNEQFDIITLFDLFGGSRVQGDPQKIIEAALSLLKDGGVIWLPKQEYRISVNPFEILNAVCKSKGYSITKTSEEGLEFSYATKNYPYMITKVPTQRRDKLEEAVHQLAEAQI